MLKEFFKNYGLSFVMVASYFGSGSIFIASLAGVEYGYALVWAVVGAVLLGFMAQDMSARLGIFGDTLMGFIRKRIGKGPALALALFLSIGCIAWALALTAAVGKSIEILSGELIPWQPLAVATGLLAIIVGVLKYSAVEKVITAMMFLLLFLYVWVAVAAQPDVGATVRGLVPSAEALDLNALAVGAAILGTTALWPNFFLESILVRRKGWNSKKHVRPMRIDLTIGYAVGGIITLCIILVAAAVLRPAGYTELTSFLAPGEALAEVLGQWAMIVFLIGVACAAFNSIIPIMWTVPYMILEAVDHDHRDGTGRLFRVIFAASIGVGMFSPLVAEVTGLSVVQMVTLFPAFNGVFGLPITAALLFWAVNDKRIMGENRNTLGLNLLNILLVIFAIYIAIRGGRGVLSQIFAFMN